ncbi:MAG: glycosyltransferase [Desulfosoma sp.]
MDGKFMRESPFFLDEAVNPGKTAPRLRIAVLCAHSHPLGPLGRRDTGGMSVYIREMSRAVAARGHRVDLFVGEPPRGLGSQGSEYTKQELEDHLGPNVHWVSVPCETAAPRDPLEQVKTAEAFRRAVLGACRGRRPFDLVFSHYWLSGLAGLYTAQALGAPHVVMFHTLAQSKTEALGRSVDAPCRLCAERLVAARSHGVVAATEREKDVLETHYGVHAERVAVVPCGVDMHVFRPGDGFGARKRLGLPLDAAVFLFVGRLDPVKGLDRLLDAFSRLPRSVPARLVVVGGDASEEERLKEFRDLAETLGVSKQVIFSGRIDHCRLPDFYAAADALVVASHYESFGLVALEALASGRPVIGPPVGVLPEVLSSPVCGVLLEDNSAQHLLGGMTILLERKGRQRNGEAALRRRIARRYSWDRVAHDLERCFHRVLETSTWHETRRTSSHGFGRCSDYRCASGRP